MGRTQCRDVPAPIFTVYPFIAMFLHQSSQFTHSFLSSMSHSSLPSSSFIKLNFREWYSYLRRNLEFDMTFEIEYQFLKPSSCSTAIPRRLTHIKPIIQKLSLFWKEEGRMITNFPNTEGFPLSKLQYSDVRNEAQGAQHAASQRAIVSTHPAVLPTRFLKSA